MTEIKREEGGDEKQKKKERLKVRKTDKNRERQIKTMTIEKEK